MTPKARIAPAGRGVSRPVADAVEVPEPLDQPRPLARAAARRPGHPGPPRRRGGAGGPRDHPVADDGRVLLIDHYRFTTGTRGWEIPSGGERAGRVGPRRRTMRAPRGDRARRAALDDPRSLSSLERIERPDRPRRDGAPAPTAPRAARSERDRRPPQALDRRGPAWVARNALRDGLSLTALAWALVAGVIAEATPELSSLLRRSRGAGSGTRGRATREHGISLGPAVGPPLERVFVSLGPVSCTGVLSTAETGP